MERIPALIQVGKSNISDLDNLHFLSQTDDDMALLRIEFSRFLKNVHAVLHGFEDVTKDEVERSFFLRVLLDKYLTQGEMNRKAENGEGSIDDWRGRLLFEVFMENCNVSNLPSLSPTFGVTNISNDWKRISNHKKSTFSVGGREPDFSGWKGLNLQKLTTQNFLIVDPFFLEDLELSKLNLRKMFDGLIDPRITIKNFKLMIIVRYDQGVEDFDQKKELDFEELDKYLKTSFPKFKFEISLAYVKRRFTHDRYFFSDFYYMSCQGGFRPYNENNQFDTLRSSDLNIFYLSNIDVARAYSKRLKEIFNWLNSSATLFDFKGDMSSPLFKILT